MAGRRHEIICVGNRDGMFHAMCSMMLNRPGMAADAARIEAQTLLLVARDDGMGWKTADAEAVAATMRDARVGAVIGTGHVTPLLLDVEGIEKSVRDFWSDQRLEA